MPTVTSDIAAFLAAANKAASRAVLSLAAVYADGVVADYNIGTGAGTDNTAAIQAAIVAASASGYSQVVILPPGDIKITAELVISNRVSLQGHGYHKTRIYATTAGQNGIWFNSALHSNCKFSGFALYGPAGHGGDGIATGVGILCDSKTAPGTYVFGPTEFDGLWISRWTTCLKLGQMPATISKQCYFGGFRLYGIHLVSTDTFQFNACSMGYGTETIDHTVEGCTTIKIEGSAVEPAGTNFSGEFTNCELGDTWKFLTLSGCRVGFESCNFETRGTEIGLTTANTLFDVSPGARLFFKNCRTGLASDDVQGANPAVIFADCSNDSAEPRVIIENSDIISGLYTTAVKYVGASYYLYWPTVIGTTAAIKWYNAALAEQQSFPFFCSVPQSRGYSWFSSVPNNQANGLAWRGLMIDYTVGAGDTTAGDEDKLFVRKTRKKIGGVVQFRRSSISNDSLAEILGSSVAITSNTTGSITNLTPAIPIIGVGTVKGSGDKISITVKGTCAANANVKTIYGWVYDADKVELTITDATAVYWEAVYEFVGVLTSTAKATLHLTAYDAAGVKVHDKLKAFDQGGFTSVDVQLYLRGNSAASNDLTVHFWDMVWRANGTKL